MMNGMHSRMLLQDWLKEAHAEATDCPSIETFAEAAAGYLSPDEVAAIEAHAALCPGCAAELDLAGLFTADETEITNRREDVDFVVSRLEERFGSANAVTPAAGDSGVIPFPAPKRSSPRFHLLARIAATVLVVVGLGLVVQNLLPTAPSLPTAGPADVTRGDSIEVLGPQGDLPAVPGQLRWRAHAAADAYRVRLVTVSETVLLEELVTSPALTVSPTLQGQLHLSAVYHWQVEALDADGGLVAWSERISFRIVGP